MILIFVIAIIVAIVSAAATVVLAMDPEGRGERYLVGTVAVFVISLAAAIGTAVKWCVT